jgi:hypothetical protein
MPANGCKVGGLFGAPFIACWLRSNAAVTTVATALCDCKKTLMQPRIDLTLTNLCLCCYQHLQTATRDPNTQINTLSAYLRHAEDKARKKDTSRIRVPMRVPRGIHNTRPFDHRRSFGRQIISKRSSIRRCRNRSTYLPSRSDTQGYFRKSPYFELT